MKTCSRCKQEKHYEDFCKMSRSKDGYQPACKTCMADSWRRSRNKKLDHYKNVQKKRETNTKFLVDEWKSQHKCVNCGEDDIVCFDLHHLDPNTKEDHPSKFTRSSFNKFLDEASKCVVLCANCHRKLHAGRFKLGFA